MPVGKRRFTAAVFTISDRSYQKQRADLSGPRVVRLLEAAGFEVVHAAVLPDEAGEIQHAICEWATRASLLVTTGGTGCAPRDVTPEATLAAMQSAGGRLVPGLSELMRSRGAQSNARSWLSRGVTALVSGCLVINLPGSPKGAEESLDVILPLLEHALVLARGDSAHP